MFGLILMYLWLVLSIGSLKRPSWVMVYMGRASAQMEYSGLIGMAQLAIRLITLNESTTM